MRLKNTPVISLTFLMFFFFTYALAIQQLEDMDQAVIDAEQALLAIEDSESSPWFFVGHSVSGFDYYLNIDTIKKYSQYKPLRYKHGGLDFTETHTKAWWRVVRTNGDYDQIQTKFYCSKSSAINVSGIMYSKDDIYQGDLKFSSFVEPIIPDTVHADISKTVCELS